MAQTSMDKLARVSPDLAEGFRALRAAAESAGPLSEEVVELIIVASLAATRQHDSLRVHLRRLLSAGVDPAAIRHSLVVGIGASTTVTTTSEALDVLDSQIAGDVT